MEDVLLALKKCLEEQEDAVIVSVADSVGSTPRSSGARMIVTGKGRMAGTIGGGKVEFVAENTAKEVLANKESKEERHTLTPGDLGMVCGGRVDLIYNYVPAADQQTLHVVNELLQQIARHEPTWIIDQIEGKRMSFGFYSESTGFQNVDLSDPKIVQTRSRRMFEADGKTFLVEPLVDGSKVYVFGGGHVAQALVPLLSTLDFYTVVFDDRPDYVTKSLFPTADELICGDFQQIGEKCSINNSDYVVIMTRGHAFDEVVLKQVLKTPAYYIGNMGSANKVRNLIVALKKAGFTDAQIERVNMPIGIKIDAETPAELGVSVGAELIQARGTKRIKKTTQHFEKKSQALEKA